jgi:hypothetical protein
MKLKLSLLALIIVAASFALKGEAYGQGKAGPKARNPAGNWTLSFRPYTGASYESMPVQLVSYKGEMQAGGRLEISALHLKNRSDKAVKSIALTMYLYDEQNPETPLTQQENLRFGFFPGGFPANTEKPAPGEATNNFVLLDVVNEENALLKPLLKDGKLDGEYRLILAVTKVQFEDGEAWSFRPPQAAAVSTR